MLVLKPDTPTDPEADSHHEEDGGLIMDLGTLLGRRAFLRGAAALGVVGAIPSTGCGVGAASACPEIPEETAGPYPGDGSNGPNILAESEVVRSDLRASIGDAVGVAGGIPLEIILTLVDASESCAPLSGHAIYLWQCDRESRYSMYSAGAQDRNYLRGVQVTDAQGEARFIVVFPGCYPGRWPHAHFEIFSGLEGISRGEDKIITSQLALPQDACEQVYASEGYGESAANLDELSFERDGVFRGRRGADQMTSVTGSLDDGFVATLTIGIKT